MGEAQVRNRRRAGGGRRRRDGRHGDRKRSHLAGRLDTSSGTGGVTTSSLDFLTGDATSAAGTPIKVGAFPEAIAIVGG